MHQQLQRLEIDPTRIPDVPMSRRLWGLDWGRSLPWTIDDVVVEEGTLDDALPFIVDNYGKIFGDDGRFLAEPMNEAKRRFCAEMDIFLMRVETRLVGLVMGHPTDWSTYYVRTTALLDDYRARGVMPRFLEHFYGPLVRAGVQRVETDVCPSNQPVIRLHIREGFVVTATGCSERWGALVHFTKFLREEPEKTFARQFCGMPALPGQTTPKKDRSRS